VDVDVSDGSGHIATLPKGFTFVAAVANVVSVTNIDVASGSVSGGTSVTITGTGFGTGIQVDFGGIPATAVNASSTTQRTATTPAHAAGLVDVGISNGTGQKASLPKSFTFV
jgi:hypothetical protein